MTWDKIAAAIAYCYTVPTPEPLNTLNTVAYGGGALFFGGHLATRFRTLAPGERSGELLMLAGAVLMLLHHLVLTTGQPAWLIARGLGASLGLIGFLMLIRHWRRGRAGRIRIL